MNLYVDEKPSCCAECPLIDIYSDPEKLCCCIDDMALDDFDCKYEVSQKCPLRFLEDKIREEIEKRKEIKS